MEAPPITSSSCPKNCSVRARFRFSLIFGRVSSQRRIAVFNPTIAASARMLVWESATYSGQEFVGLYPYVSDGTSSGGGKNRLWIHRSPNIYVEFEAWLAGSEPKPH